MVRSGLSFRRSSKYYERRNKLHSSSSASSCDAVRLLSFCRPWLDHRSRVWCFCFQFTLALGYSMFIARACNYRACIIPALTAFISVHRKRFLCIRPSCGTMGGTCHCNKHTHSWKRRALWRGGCWFSSLQETGWFSFLVRKANPNPKSILETSWLPPRRRPGDSGVGNAWWDCFWGRVICSCLPKTTTWCNCNLTIAQFPGNYSEMANSLAL